MCSVKIKLRYGPYKIRLYQYTLRLSPPRVHRKFLELCSFSHVMVLFSLMMCAVASDWLCLCTMHMNSFSTHEHLAPKIFFAYHQIPKGICLYDGGPQSRPFFTHSSFFVPHIPNGKLTQKFIFQDLISFFKFPKLQA